MIRPENADQVVDLLPSDPDCALHAVVCGDFVFCDLVKRIVERLGAPGSITIASLSLSMKNLDCIVEILKNNPTLKLDLLLSHYFQSTNGEIFASLGKLVCDAFPDRARVTVGRSHAKVCIFDWYDSPPLVIETSANLRSSGNIEQIGAFRGRELADFHLMWIEEFRKSPANLSKAIFTGDV